jgi:nucleoside-diphosphate-sugar epimerase
MGKNPGGDWIVGRDETVLVTGAGGFVGSRVVDSLIRLGFNNIRCLTRAGSENALLQSVLLEHPGNQCEVIQGNLLSRQDCARAADGVSIVYHLVAGRGKSFPGCFQGSVVTTRNLLDAAAGGKSLKRFVNVSSYIIYSNRGLAQRAVWDESCPLEDDIGKRFDAYLYGKFKQDEMVRTYHQKRGVPYTIVCPTIVFGPGKKTLPGSLGLDTFGIFMRVGGAGRMPLTYVDNCADAIALAGLVPGVDGEVFNVTDDDLPKSRSFLRQYKKRVGRFRSVWVPYPVMYGLCWLWELYAAWSKGQLPPVFNRRNCAFSWKGHRYSNGKLKERLGWQCRVPMKDALDRYFRYQKNG